MAPARSSSAITLLFFLMLAMVRSTFFRATASTKAAFEGRPQT